VPEAEPKPFRVASYTRLVHRARDDLDARDHDEVDVPRPKADDDVAPTGIFAFPRGAEAGTCLHKVLESVDWQRLDDPQTATMVADTLRNHRIQPGEGLPDPAAAVLANLRDLAAARALPDGTTLAQVCGDEPQPRASEWEFFLGAEHGGLAGLFDRLAAHGSDLAKQYAEACRRQSGRLLGERINGFFTGSIDRIARYGGKFWVIDWKSNHLGNRAENYDQAAMRSAMLHHQYVLQYHLYAIAVHRQLTQRLPGYDPAQHFGGAIYVFVRGATPGADHGILVEPIAPELLTAMDDWLRGAE
jgi:exodeoxyribonuclease V beta subunit